MATKTFPGSTSGVVFTTNTFTTVAWAPADGYVGSGSQTETAGNHSNLIAIGPDFPFDLSTLGATAGNITQAIVTYAHAGTYATAGPGANYDFTNFNETHTQAEGAAWSSSSTFDATLFFTDGLTYFTDMADLPAYPWYPAFAGGGNIENGVTFGYTISVLSIEFTYTPAGAVVTDVSPTHGDLAGGTVVTLTGTGFTGATSVLFGSTEATDIVVASDTSLTCIAPAHAVGDVAVSVS